MVETKPIALFSGYGEVPSRQTYKPDKFSRLQVLAAAELLRRGKISKAVFLAGNISSDGSFGTDKLGGIAVRMGDQLRRNLPNLPEDSVIVMPTAMSTVEEVVSFSKLAKENGWNNLMVIAKDSHLKRVQRAVRRTFGKTRTIPTTTQEAVLTESPQDILYQQIIAKVKNSSEEKGFTRREMLINLIDSIPIIGELVLRSMNRSKTLEVRVHKILSR